jgi:glycosyltransferase involved in cell wall biosynthesis
MEVAISVIIPVYNSEHFLDRCLSSVLSQTFVNFEVLLINDGSTDGSIDICERYEKEDSRIRFFNRSNHGVSATRQFGIDHCKGKYCIQIDSDDWIDYNCLEVLYKKAVDTNSDIVYMGLIEEYLDKSVLSRVYKSNNIDDYLSALLNGKCWGNVWNKLVLKSLIKDYNISFPDNVCMWEDLSFICKCMMCAKSISFCDTVYYHYNKSNISSLCSTVHKFDMPSNTIAAILDIESFALSIGRNQKFIDKLSLLKQFAKQKLLFDPYFRNVKKWFSVFPESNTCFFNFIFRAIYSKLFPCY